MTRTLGRVLTLMTAISLSACGGGGSSGSAAPASGTGDTGNYMPLSVGNRWVYQATETTPAYGTVHYSQLAKVSNALMVAGHNTLALQTSDLVYGNILSETHVAKSGTALQQFFDVADGAPEQYEGTVTLMRLPLRSGDSYVAQDQYGLDLGSDYDHDGHNESLAIHTDVTVSGPETVAVPAGTYANALKVTSVSRQTVTYSGNNAQAIVTFTTTYWLVPNLGPVKKTVAITSPGYTATRELLLSGYNVEGNSSDLTAPTVLQSLPGNGTTSGNSEISLTMSEPLDITGASGLVFSVVDGASQPVSGSVSYNNGKITFVPSATLASGTYTVTLVAARDALGNALGTSYSWTLTIDATAPTVASTTPAASATNVGVNSTVSIDFSEAMDAGSFTINTVSITGGAANQLSPVVSGSHVVLTPVQPLALGTTYTVTVGTSVKDLYGNALAGSYSFSFTTVPKLFLPYTATATGSWPDAVAIGDVNADGRNDVVMTTSSYGSSPNDSTLFVFLQNADGTLAAPAKFSYVMTGSCNAVSVAIGDVTGDGTPDIVLGEGSCGIAVFQRQTDGSWSSSGMKASPNAQKIRIADVNNDGRLDVVGAGWGTNTVSVWTQKTSGDLNAPVSYTLTHSGYEDMDVGDINGDGLTDIVVSSGQGSTSTSIAVLPQAAAGGFGTPAYYSTSGVNGAVFNNVAGVAIGDINNDGRKDIVVTIGGNRPNSEIGVLYQQANGTLGALSTLASYDIPGPVEISDADNDGRNDVIVLHNGWTSMGLYRQNGSGGLQGEELFGIPYASSYNPNGLAVGDINGDGFKDAVIADYNHGLVILYNSQH
ncbi:MAG: FG-GAP-like repeat-containing protein [bacterium]|nr:FG-GAP-like repeat-containing protein [bacterium]